MSNPFKKILPNHKVSSNVKHKVLVDARMIKHTFEIADRYVLKYPRTLTNFYINLK